MYRRVKRRKSLLDNGRDESGKASDRGRSLRMRELEGKRPRLRDEIVAEAVMRLLLNETETGSLVQVPGGIEAFVGPESDLPVARLPREPNALGHESPSDAESAGGGLDQQEPELGDRRGLLDQEDASDVVPIPLGDPASLPFRIEVSQEPSGDFRHEGLELRIPGILFGVDRPVALNDPTDIAGLVGSQEVWLGRVSRGPEETLDAGHRLDQAMLVAGAER